MRKIKLPKDTEITLSVILELIEEHELEKKRIIRMKDYYKNRNSKIIDRTYKDKNKPSNRLAHNYAGYITNSYVGYMLGQPVSYKSDNQDLLDKINNVFMYNDEADTNTTIAQEQSICGYAYEIVYTDEDANVRFKPVPTENMIVVYDNDLEEKMQFAIRYFDIKDIIEDEEYQQVEVYTKYNKSTYIKDASNISFISEEDHFFNDIPVVDYDNNNNRIGDFENVISLIDAYDQANSDTANDFEYFTNALLVISGVLMEETDEQGRPLNFKDNRVLNFLDANSKAEYLIKDINDTALENYKNRLNQDIHKFANVVDMSDSNFASNLSGVAMKYKLSGMEYLTGIKESKFKKGLMRRIELLVNILNIKNNNDFVYLDIKPVFVRNIPANEEELVSMAKNLYGIVSEETLLSLLPFVEDVQAEKDAIAKEKENQAIEYDNFGSEIDEG
ncbi:phage portal protein%2C SPP1 family [uncultured Clostridium sp.]|nr:phage portal protein%2C SPP1 family [uncultured Clostridium sp.]